MLKNSTYLLFSLCLLLSSCAGYKMTNSSNPLAIYGIYTVAVPMFVNKTSLPNVSGHMTSEIKNLLISFTDLKVRSSFDKKSDAVLIGIIGSPKHRKDAAQTTTTTFVSGGLKKSIGSRNEFFVPSQTKINLSLRLILIKRPSEAEYELMKTSMGQYMIGHPKNKIVFNDILALSGSYSRVVTGSTTVDQGGAVNFTKNKKAEESTIKALANGAARDFKEVILNAF